MSKWTRRTRLAGAMGRFMTGFLPAVGVVASFSACLVVTDEPASGTTTSSSSTSSSSGMGPGGNGGMGGFGSGGEAGTGGMTLTECLGDADCMDMTQCEPFSCECMNYRCMFGSCEPAEPRPAGTPVGTQIPGDCHHFECNGNGVTTEAPDPTDGVSDANDCTDDVCVMGVTEHPPSAEGTPCSEGLCDGQGQCIQCVDTTQCADGTICVASSCVSPSCADGLQNASESDVDCGGACPRCAAGKQCGTNADCASDSCVNGTCA